MELYLNILGATQEGSPTHLSALLGLGACWRRLRNTEAALECYRRVELRQPGHPDSLVLLGQVLLDEGLLERSREAFRQAYPGLVTETQRAECRRFWAQAQTAWGQRLQQAGQPEQAAEWWVPQME